MITYLRSFICGRITLLFFFIAAGVGTVYGIEVWDEASEKCDSLKNILHTQILTSQQKLELYREITNIYSMYVVDSVIKYGPKTITLAQELKNPETEFGIRMHLGAAYFFTGDHENSIRTLEQARLLAIEMGNKLYEVRAICMCAHSYMLEGKYNTAIDIYLKTLPIHEEIGNTWGKITVLINMGKIYRKLNNMEAALQYMNEAKMLSEKLRETNYPAYAWRMANLSNDYAAIHLEDGEPEKALVYALTADTLNAHGIIYKCHTKTLLAKIHFQQHDYERAFEYASEAMIRANIINDNSLRKNIWLVLSDIYMAQARYEEAEQQAFIGLQTDSTDIDLSRKLAANLVLANIYMNNMEKAAHYFKGYSNLNELFSRKSFHTTMSDMSVKYETDKKEIRITSLEKEKQLYVWIGIAGILFTVSLCVLLWQNIKSTRREKQLIAARAIQDGEMRERERIAADLHDRLLGTISAIKLEVDNTVLANKLDGCIDEVRSITQDLMPLRLRLGLKAALEDFTKQFPAVYFHFFGQEKSLGKRLEFALYCCVNELVSNSVRHSGAKSINVQLIQGKNHISLTVQDDGCGFDENSVVKGLGLKNIRDRVALYNGKIDIYSAPGKGTETTIEISKVNDL